MHDPAAYSDGTIRWEGLGTINTMIDEIVTNKHIAQPHEHPHSDQQTLVTHTLRSRTRCSMF